jgi:hypothetical protein
MGGAAAARLATLKIWQGSCIAGALAATALAAIHQIAVSSPSVATANARVADAFSAVPLKVTTLLPNAAADLPAPVTEAKFDTSPSANAIVAAAFSAAAPDAVMPSDMTGSLRQERLLRALASFGTAPLEKEATSQQDRTPAASPSPDESELPYPKDYASLENEATSEQDRPPAASPNPDESELPYLKNYASLENEATSEQDRPPAASPNADESELPYLKYYVYSETPPPEKPVKIALAALKDVPLGTPVQEIERAAKAFGVDANFMKAVAKIESDFNPKERTGSYIGLFQLSKSEFRQYGTGDILNSRDNAMAAAYKFVTEAALFEAITHRKLTFADLYLVHQQGWEGAAEHVSHPQQIAWKSMCATHEGMAKGQGWCKRAIWGNTLPAVKREWKSVDRLTSGAFVAMWRDRVETLYARYPAPRRPDA